VAVDRRGEPAAPQHDSRSFLPRWRVGPSIALVVGAYIVGTVALAVWFLAGLCSIAGESSCSATARATASGGLVVLVVCWFGGPVAAAILSRQPAWLALPAALVLAAVGYHLRQVHRQGETAQRITKSIVATRNLATTVNADVNWPTFPFTPGVATPVAQLRHEWAADTAALRAAQPTLAAAGIDVSAIHAPFSADISSAGGSYCLYAEWTQTPISNVVQGRCLPQDSGGA
jgi:hypothetical protein